MTYRVYNWIRVESKPGELDREQECGRLLSQRLEAAGSTRVARKQSAQRQVNAGALPSPHGVDD